jgi:hypothetical protein
VPCHVSAVVIESTGYFTVHPAGRFSDGYRRETGHDDVPRVASVHRREIGEKPAVFHVRHVQQFVGIPFGEWCGHDSVAVRHDLLLNNLS